MTIARATYQAAAMLIPCGLYVPFVHAAPAQPSPIISVGKDGHLVYHADTRGNRVPDVSHCGYAGGDRPIPDVPVKWQPDPKQSRPRKVSRSRKAWSGW